MWVHGVSVGEVKAAARLIERIEQRVPGVEVVVTATTDTGYRVARERYPGHRVEFYPPDLSWIVRDALDRLRPDLVVLVESEFWPNFLAAVAAPRHPDGALVNGRISARSAGRFRKGGPLDAGPHVVHRTVVRPAAGVRRALRVARHPGRPHRR